jgi:hypothetical protein
LRLWEDEHGITPETVITLFEDVFGGLFAGVDDEFAAVEGGDEVYWGIAVVDSDDAIPQGFAELDPEMTESTASTTDGNPEC